MARPGVGAAWGGWGQAGIGPFGEAESDGAAPSFGKRISRAQIEQEKEQGAGVRVGAGDGEGEGVREGEGAGGGEEEGLRLGLALLA